ncbi:hypothetical protein EDD85DRAFT_733136, partial [Armillaria nabsnona]
LTIEHPDIAEAWINMLHDIYAVLVEVHGFSSTAINVIWFHLFIDVLSLRPCDPT